MISAKKLIKMVNKWQKMAATRRQRITLPSRNNGNEDMTSCSAPAMADKGHFVVYTTDRRRFMIPLVYINNNIFRELFKMSEEEFGLPCDGPITLPFDAVFMVYIVSLIQRGAAKDLERALLISITSNRRSSFSCFHQRHKSLELPVCGYLNLLCS